MRQKKLLRLRGYDRRLKPNYSVKSRKRLQRLKDLGSKLKLRQRDNALLLKMLQNKKELGWKQKLKLKERD